MKIVRSGRLSGTRRILAEAAHLDLADAVTCMAYSCIQPVEKNSMTLGLDVSRIGPTVRVFLDTLLILLRESSRRRTEKLAAAGAGGATGAVPSVTQRGGVGPA